MKRILILIAISVTLCSTAHSFQGGGGESTKIPKLTPKPSLPSAPRPKVKPNKRSSPQPLGVEVRDPPQFLRRYQPQTQGIEPSETNAGLAVENGIALSTAKRFDRYISERYYGGELWGLEIYRVPHATRELFLAVTGGGRLFLLSEIDEQVIELSQTELEDVDCLTGASLNFFVGTDRALIFVSSSAVDGYCLTVRAIQYKDERLMPLGKIRVYKAPFQRPYSTEPFHSPFNPGYGMDSVASEYKNGTYYLTIKGALYVDCPKGMRRIDNANSRTVLFYDGKVFRPLQSTQVRRRCEFGML